MIKWLRDGLEGVSPKAVFLLYLFGLAVLIPFALAIRVLLGEQTAFIFTLLLATILVGIQYSVCYLTKNTISLSISLLKLLYKTLTPQRSQSVRCTLLIPDKREGALIQLARYSPDGEGVSKSRIPFRRGVAGECFENKQTVLESVKEGVDFFTHAGSRWFTTKEAKQFRSDRKSYLCVPIKENGVVVGIISLDSKESNAFTESMGEAIEKHFAPVFLKVLHKKAEKNVTEEIIQSLRREKEKKFSPTGWTKNDKGVSVQYIHTT